MVTRAMALAHDADSIRVNAVSPGPVMDTVLMEKYIAAAEDPTARVQSVIRAAPWAAVSGRLITPEEIAFAVLYLCSDAAAMITGGVLAIDSGKSAGIS